MMYRKGKMLSVAILNILLLAAPIATQTLTVKADADSGDNQTASSDSDLQTLADAHKEEAKETQTQNPNGTFTYTRTKGVAVDNDGKVNTSVSDNDGSSDTDTPESNKYATTTASGTIGTAKWNLTNDGVLHIQGGQLPAYDGKSFTSPFRQYTNNIKTVSFDAKTTADANSENLFKDLKYLENIAHPENFDTSNVTDMSGMFDNTGLKDLSQVGKLNVANVTKMDAMFENTPITDLTPISGWNVSKLTSANGMFSGSKIESLTPLSNWQPTSLTNATEMFSSTPIKSLDGLQNWKTDNLTNMSAIFYNDGKVESLAPIANWNVANVKSMAGSFAGTGVSDLTPISKWNTGSVTDMSNMLAHTNISTVDPITNLDTSNVTSMYGMLSNNPNLKTVSGLNWDLGKAQDISGLLSDNKNLENADLSSLKNVNAVTDISEMFESDPLLKDVDISSFDTKNVDTSDDVFKNSNSLAKINFGSNFKLNKSTVAVPMRGKDGWMNTKDATKKIANNEIASTSPVDGTYTLTAPSVTAKVLIHSNAGDVYSEPVTGEQGQTISVPVPNKPGYKIVGPKSVSAIVNTDGKIQTTEMAEYKQIGNGGGNSGTTNTVVVNHNVVKYVDKPTIVHENNLVSTHFDQSYFNLYNLEDNTMVKSGTRALAKGTDWFSDEVTSVDGLEYYRVATNEWIRANDVYVYIPSNRIVTIKNDRSARLKDAQDDLIGNRALGNGTSWKSDRVTKFDNKTYYRVATNEFASIDDIK